MPKILWSLFILTAVLLAQSERANLTGSVTDPSGAPIASATVIVIHLDTNTTAAVKTTPGGDYNVSNLSPGRYRVEMSAGGFKRFVREDVTLTAAGTVRLDAQLSLGQLTETVQVTAAVAQVQTENAKISTVVQNRMVDELPLVVGGALRSPFNLVTVTPEARGDGGTLSLGGGQAAAWNATLDGISVTTNRAANTVEIAYNAPSVEAITEFTVDTNGFKAEYGQAGGGVMTFVSKSGTNQVHGSAYDFLRNDKLDARGFFPLTKSVYKQNDFGATLGGPVSLPKLYNGKNRTFFFISYEGFRNRVGGNAIIKSIPTPEMYEGDFSKWVDQSNRLLQIYDPATTRQNPGGTGFIRDPFANNLVPKARFSGISQKLIPFGQAVKPNRPGLIPGTNAYINNNFISTSGSTLTPTDKGSARIDHTFTARHRIGFLYNITRFRTEVGPGGPPGLPIPLWDGLNPWFDSQDYRMSYDWTVSPHMLNHISVGANQFNKYEGTPNRFGGWKAKGICIPNAVDCDVNMPIVAFTEFSGWGGTSWDGTDQPLWALKDDFNYIRNKHTLKFGYDFQSQRANGWGEERISGQNSFSFLGTSVPGATSFTSGSSFASFLLGDANSGATETFKYVQQRYAYHGFYAQDDWRVTPRLTLNLGLRYEFTLPPINLQGDEYSNFDPTRPNPAVNNYPGAVVFAGFGKGRENRRSLVPGWYGGIGPRIGIAYSPESKTTLRAGFGRSFSKVTVVSGSGHFAGFVGQYQFNSPDQGVTPAYNWDKGFPSYVLPPLFDPAFSNNNTVDYWQLRDAARAPENLFWTFSIQRQVSANTVIEAAYNANVGTHLQAGLVNINQTPTAYLNQFIRQYGATAALNLLRADINSAQARSAGIPLPYPNFTNPSVQQIQTVNQALRPFPQYQTIITGSQGGDKSGHLTYHALVLKIERRYSHGLTFQWNYVLSKLMTDADSYNAPSGAGAAQDQYNRRLEKSIGAFDQTHVLKMSTVYELPFGPGRKYLTGRGLAGQMVGGWRLSGILTYMSGFPVALTRNNPFPIFNGTTRPIITTYDNWRAPLKSSEFDPNVDLFFNKSVFPAQPSDQFGNVTRYSPKLRSFPNLNENISMAKSFVIRESKRIDFRWETFNLLNRTVFALPSTNLNSASFGLVTSQSNSPRQMQVALKFYW
jgi:outer membrane receptor protein involved in Fe transport